MNRINSLFGIKYPIIAGGMVWCSGWRLASAVSNAGGLGLIGAGSMHPETLREHIEKCREATDKPFGVNIPLMYPQIEELMHLVVDEGVKIVFTSAGNPKTWTPFLKEHGITVAQVLTMKESFATRRHYLNQKRCMTVMLENGVIPIVNENDTVRACRSGRALP